MGQEQRAEGQRGSADGEVDVEDPPPGQPVHEQPADHRAERGRQQHRHDHQPVGPDPLGRRERAEHHRHAHRHEQAAAKPLQRAERDKLGQRCGEPAHRGRGGKQPDRTEHHAPGPEAVPQPSGGGHRHRERHQVGGHHAAHGRHRHREIAAQRRQRHIDDGRIHDVHEHRRDEHRADDHLGTNDRLGGERDLHGVLQDRECPACSQRRGISSRRTETRLTCLRRRRCAGTPSPARCTGRCRATQGTRKRTRTMA